MNLIQKLKTKSVGYYILLASTVLGLIVSVMYIAFGVSSHTFAAGIFVCALFAFLLGVALAIYEGVFADCIPIVMIVLMSVALVLLIADSIDDVTALFVGMGDYFGNADNVGMRVTLAVFMILSIITAIVGSFFSRVRKQEA